MVESYTEKMSDELIHLNKEDQTYMKKMVAYIGAKSYFYDDEARQIDLIGLIKFFHILYSLTYQTLKKLLTDLTKPYSRSGLWNRSPQNHRYTTDLAHFQQQKDESCVLFLQEPFASDLLHCFRPSLGSNQSCKNPLP